MVVISPKPGQNAEFEKGYERHLEWHRKAQDTWTWYGWSFVLGSRLGQFMDGTFGHAMANFDAAVQPAADSADNALNVTPHADFLSHGIYKRLDSVSAGAPLPDTSPFLAMSTYEIEPGQQVAFEEALGEQWRKAGAGKRYTWYRLQIGGQAPQYVLMRAAASFGAAAELPEVAPPARMVRNVRTELLRYRENLSYRPRN
ncbi:hypothetical protein [Massilia endophytica]|uniref:hypothetical protein n=1 Tax=Massilia endophytica TaxID=2899220 RepID=UPI001E3CC37F|nr:hypothetical protein [Massilia endophytica]UGQ48276.1 hypothetical protein LSQ66_07375 [Massilia endophytica]